MHFGYHMPRYWGRWELQQEKQCTLNPERQQKSKWELVVFLFDLHLQPTAHCLPEIFSHHNVEDKIEQILLYSPKQGLRRLPKDDRQIIVRTILCVIQYRSLVIHDPSCMTMTMTGSPWHHNSLGPCELWVTKRQLINKSSSPWEVKDRNLMMMLSRKPWFRR